MGRRPTQGMFDSRALWEGVRLRALWEGLLGTWKVSTSRAGESEIAKRSSRAGNVEIGTVDVKGSVLEQVGPVSVHLITAR